MIEKRGNSYYVLSQTGKKLGGPYSSYGEAANRLRQIEWFKSTQPSPKKTKPRK